MIFGWRTADGDRTRRGIVNVGHGCGAGAADTLAGTLIVGVARDHRNHRADVGLYGGVGRTRRPTNGHAVAVPLVTDCPAQAVGIGQGIAGRQRVALGRGHVIDGDAAGRGIVDIDNGSDACTHDGFVGTLTIQIAGLDGDGRADIQITQRVGRAGGAPDGEPIAVPLVGHRTHPVHIGQGIGSGQDLIFGWRTTDSDRTRRGIVNVGHGRGTGTTDTLAGTLIVGVARDDRNHRADVGLDRGVGRTRRTADGHAIPIPLITDRPTQAVGIGQRVRCRQRVALGRGHVVDGDAAGRGIVDIADGSNTGTGQDLVRTLPIQVSDLHRHSGTDIIIIQYVGGAGGTANGYPVAVPLIAEGTQTIGVRDARGICCKDLILGHRSGDGRRTDR